MQNLSDPDTFSNQSFNFLIGNKADAPPPLNNLPYGVVLLIIQYTLLLPIIILCWILLLKFLREHGYITQTQADEIVDTLSKFPMREID